jgi:peptide/nickel transport system permease protein
MSGAYLLRRLLLAVPTLFGVAVVVFVLLRVVPGDPIAMMIPPGARQADIDNLRALYGLDRPILVQFVAWLGALRRAISASRSASASCARPRARRLPASSWP